jgi:hypothetical protein
MAASLSADLSVFSGLMIVPLNVAGTFNPLFSAVLARSWIARETSS